MCESRLTDKARGFTLVDSRSGNSRDIESFNGKLRDECLNREWFRDLRDAGAVIESWREFYNHRRPHHALGYRSPA